MPDGIGLDVITLQNGEVPSASGSVATQLLRNGFKINSLRTLAVLRKDEWVQFDEALIEIARQRLIAVGDLLTAGLRFDVSNALGTTSVEWEQLSDMSPAEINMSGVTEGERDRVLYTLQSVPLPIIHKDFNVNIRALEASRKMGDSVDVTQAQLAARLVAESTEAMLFNGANVRVAGSTILGYTTATNRNTGAILAGVGVTGWLDVAATGELIVRDVLNMIAAAIGDNMYGPYMLYVPKEYYNKLSDDYKAASDRTIIERIEAIPDIMGVRPTQNLTGAGASGDEVLLVQMTTDVVDMVVGQQPTTVQWDSQGGMVVNFKIMSIMTPRVKNDASGQSGIVHFTLA